jgi:putative membrane protein
LLVVGIPVHSSRCHSIAASDIAPALSRGFRTSSFSANYRHAAALFMASVLASTRIPLSVWGAANMMLIANCLVAVVAALHVYFLVLEMFLWTKPLGLKTFRNTIEKATESAVLAANQGLYNGFLAAGLVWGLIHTNPGFAFQIKAFFLLCVIVAGAYGAATVSRRILYVQAAPAALALILLWLA